MPHTAKREAARKAAQDTRNAAWNALEKARFDLLHSNPATYEADHAAHEAANTAYKIAYDASVKALYALL